MRQFGGTLTIYHLPLAAEPQLLRIRHIFGCRAAAFLQKLPWRRKAKSGDRFGLLSCWWLVPRTSEIFTGRSEGQKVGGRQERIFQFGGPN
jgi:hypothetical protein